MRKFYQLTPGERLEKLQERGKISKDEKILIKDQLDLETADQMVENVLSTYALPYGLALNFLIDGQPYDVPMAVEEPSVVAAASGAAKTIAKAGGFKTKVDQREMIGQVALTGVENFEKAEEKILTNKNLLISLANQAYPSIVERGGGVRDIWVDSFPASKRNRAFFNIYVSLDAKEAMGANMLNTVLESLSPELENLSGGQALVSILSNYATNCLATATCRIPFDLLAYKGLDGEVLADKITAASELAQVDIYRAATHNKGIMNGIDAVVLATGNDWRAIEAGAHAYASRDGQYRGLSQWWVEEDTLVGEIELPLPIGTVGGSIRIHPQAKASYHLMEIDKAVDLEKVIASVGLAQNFAAMRALVSEGIQKGHMSLQAKSLALAVGAEKSEVEKVVKELKKGRMNQATAKEILEKIRLTPQ